MDLKLKKKLFDIIYVVLIISLICFLIWVVTFMKGNARECFENPIKYFEDKNEGAVCSCIKDGVTWPQTSYKVENKEESQVKIYTQKELNAIFENG